MKICTLIVGGALAMGSMVAVGCGGAQKTNLAQSANDKIVQNIPDWYNSPPDDPNFLFDASSETSRDMQMAVEKAKLNSRASLAQTVGDKISALSKRLKEELAQDSDSEYLDTMNRTIKSVTDQNLVGVSVHKQQIVNENGIYRAYVLMKLPIGEYRDQLVARIAKNNELYLRVREMEAFKELDKEVKSLRNE